MVGKFQGEKLKIFWHHWVVFRLDRSELLLAPMLSVHLEKKPVKLKAIQEVLRKSLCMDNNVTSMQSEEERFHSKI
jgi:hypothetical protein